MKSEAVFEGLKDLAQKLGITVSEQNFRRLGVRAKSGFCIVKGKSMFLVDKQSAISEKIEILSSYLATLPTDHIYIIPAIRQRLQLAQKGGKGPESILQLEDSK
ncbi:MAG: hypothetical protein COS92_08335 [Desulfobacterales bacterium CG07_land_8_20_14_0_80_52_14]|nr:MAG: hypothetical protein COS92_08335 [Desulfobacterales bacterium CG07_land_8_20_14_0_80_52_14]